MSSLLVKACALPLAPSPYKDLPVVGSVERIFSSSASVSFPLSTFPALDLAFVSLLGVSSDHAMNSCEMLLSFPARLQIPAVFKPGVKISLRTRKTAPSSLLGAFWDSQRKSFYFLPNPALLSGGVMIGKVLLGNEAAAMLWCATRKWADCSGWVPPSSHSLLVWREAQCWERQFFPCED